MFDDVDPEEINRIVAKRFGDLTVLEFQQLMVALEDSRYQNMRVSPESMDLANRIGDLTVPQFVTPYIDSLPRGGQE